MSATALKSNGETFYHTSYTTPLQNAQIPPNTYFELAPDIGVSNDGFFDSGVAQPFLEICIQPCDKFRFRYKSESGSHGKLRGPAKNRSKANFPTVKVHNWYESHDNVKIRATLYTCEDNPKPHILELVGKNCTNGACSEKLSEDKTAIFRFLEIESKRKEEAINILMEKKIELVDDIRDKEEIRKEVIEDMKQLNMNCAILCFEALQNNIPICEKVFSGPIKNLKSTSSDLKITRISSSSGSCRGGDDIILLCDKINKDDIEIHFYEKDENDEILFEGNGIFNPKVDVHHQVAIAFKTPQYRNNIGATVQMELYRRSDKQSSEPRTFTFIPDDIDALRYSKKRKFNPAECVELQDLNQASNSSDFMSSLSNSSGLEACAAFEGSPCTSSIDEDFDQFIDGGLAHFLFGTRDGKQVFVDSDNFNDYLEFTSPAAENESTVQMDAAAFNSDHSQEFMGSRIDWDKYYENEPSSQSIFSPQSAVGNDLPIVYDESNVEERPHRDSIGISIANLATESLSNLWNTTVGRAVSFMKPSSSDNKSDTTTLSHKYVAKGEMADPVVNAPYSAEYKIYPQSLTFYMEELSIQEDSKIDVKPFVSSSDNNLKSPLKMVDKTCFTDANSCDIKDTRKVEVISKASEINKNFDSVKEGVTEIMRRRGKDVYLHYISKLMSVKDENGNLFIHLAVLEQGENLNLMARILKIAPHIINEQNRFKETPLHLATQQNAWKMALLLLAQGGNPSIGDVHGNNCFHIASKSNCAKSMKMLLFPSLSNGKRIPSIDGFNYDGFSPLHLSVMNNAKECMQLLLKAGANVNINDRTSGSSPLHVAIKQQPALASDLLSHPDVDLSNSDFNGHSIVHALCVIKGVPMPGIDKFTDIVNWAHKTLALPSKDSDQSSGTDTSSNSDSEDEGTQQHETEATPSFNYSRNIQPQGGVEEKLNSLSEECEKRLCKILDGDGGWRKLGLFVGLDEKILDGASKLSKNSSPSKLVLGKVKKLYQKCDKQTLINILTAADLQNAAEMLRNETF